MFIACKCGIVFKGMDEEYDYKAYDLSPSYLKASCEASLKRLGVEYIDLYQQPHRVDYLTHRVGSPAAETYALGPAAVRVYQGALIPNAGT